MNSPKRCRCGGTDHVRTTNKNCPYYETNEQTNKKTKTPISNNNKRTHLTPILQNLNCSPQMTKKTNTRISSRLNPQNLRDKFSEQATHSGRSSITIISNKENINDQEEKTETIEPETIINERITPERITPKRITPLTITPETNNVQCSICKKTYKSQKTLRVHLRDRCDQAKPKKHCNMCHSDTHERKSSHKCPFNVRNLPINKVNLIFDTLIK